MDILAGIQRVTPKRVFPLASASYPLTTVGQNEGDRFVRMAGQGSESGSGPQEIGGTRKVLVADDEPLFQRAVVRSLRGFLGLSPEDFLLAGNLRSALEVYSLHQREITAVLTDVDMPGEGAGLKLHHELRETYRFQGPIAIVSGRLYPEDPVSQEILSRHKNTRIINKGFLDLKTLADWIKSFWS